MSLTIENIKRNYDRIKRRAWRAFRSGDYNTALRELSTAATVAYSFNWMYSDPDSEELLKQISRSMLGTQIVTKKTNRIVFYDAFGWDNKGLTQQYIRAFRELKTDFLFVFENHDPHCSKAISLDLAQCGNRVEIFEIDRRKSPAEQCRMLSKKLKEYAPSSAFLQLNPGSTIALCTFTAFADIAKYNLNLTDHAFWLGCKCMDYNIEYRNFGQTISIEKRGFSSEQLFQLPYYPIQDKSAEFQGWPDNPAPETIKIFSGSSFYKIYGDNARFFDLTKRILSDNPMAVIYFAGWGNATLLKKFIAENNFEKRFILLEHRNDIDAIFEHCDIYLGTYPISGGLMSQYAAIHQKPILTYTDKHLPANTIEDVVCHNSNVHVTYYSLEEFSEYARKLCHNDSFRKSEGRRFKGCVITPEQFTAGLNNILTRHQSYKPYNHINIDYQKWQDLYLETENDYLRRFRRRFLRYRLKAFFTTPILFIKSFFR